MLSHSPKTVPLSLLGGIILVMLVRIGVVYPQPEADMMDRTLARELEKASEKLLFEAERLYEEDQFWECARDLIILLDFNPNYSKIDQAVFLLGDCLYQLGIMDGAKRIYRYLVKKYIRSPLLPRALLGLQRIEYDTGNYNRSIEFFNAISRGTPPRDILDVARYYAGLSFYHIKDYPNAIKTLRNIGENSPYYDYGLYSIGLSMLRMKRVRDAIRAFRAVIRLPIVNDERRYVVDETHLTLGYIYFELGYYKHALGQFKAVSSNHEHYNDALLAQSWAAINMEKYNEAVAPLTDLLTLYPEDDTNEEAFFLLGRCYLKLGMYDEALRVYEHLIEIFPERDVVPAIVKEVNLSLAEENVKIEKIKMELLMMESKLLDVIPYQVDESTPSYLKEEREKLNELRMMLLKRIQQERKTFNEFTEQLAKLRKLAERREQRRDWRAYAQYGKSRALFMKTRQQQN